MYAAFWDAACFVGEGGGGKAHVVWWACFAWRTEIAAIFAICAMPIADPRTHSDFRDKRKQYFALRFKGAMESR